MHANFYDATLGGCQIGLRRTRKDAPENSCKSNAGISDAYFRAVDPDGRGCLVAKGQPLNPACDQAGKYPRCGVANLPARPRPLINPISRSVPIGGRETAMQPQILVR